MNNTYTSVDVVGHNNKEKEHHCDIVSWFFKERGGSVGNGPRPARIVQGTSVLS